MATESEIRDALGQEQLPEQRSVRVEAVDAVAGCRPDAPGAVQPDPVELPHSARREDIPAHELPVWTCVENADVVAPRVHDVQERLVE